MRERENTEKKKQEQRETGKKKYTFFLMKTIEKVVWGDAWKVTEWK